MHVIVSVFLLLPAANHTGTGPFLMALEPHRLHPLNPPSPQMSRPTGDKQ